MKNKIVIFTLILLGFFSCKKENDEILPNNNEKLIGYWTNATFSDSVIQIKRDFKLTENSYGFRFMENGKFVERKNSGFCGTPPISYGNFDGTWEVNDSIVNIKVDYWGGKATYKWRIMSLTNTSLKIIIQEQKYDLSSLQ